ncbi:unnamed protein product [Paramecium octaurelia]|uniref:Uncharacterized protein n=1 Tax=Paramecium octaurelia TaxID=43137 RepID=A0A8S1WPE2_PAROT|nr:unnamed protein product [Paramecium octaurelia]
MPLICNLAGHLSDHNLKTDKQGLPEQAPFRKFLLQLLLLKQM